MAFYFAGIDIGAATAKAVILDDEEAVVGWAVRRSGVNFKAAAEDVFSQSLKQAGLGRGDIAFVFSTGYGRKNVPFAHQSRTEIACHAKGCHHYFPEALTIIDIGGQDNKIIKLAANGSRLSFKMNRKCAAGTGAFLEEMAARLNLELGEMNALAEEAKETVELGAYCTVFSATEVLEKIRAGRPITGIIKGVFTSMVKRALEMDFLEDRVVLTGGVAAHNPIIVSLLAEQIGRPVSVPPQPQLTGALGAALLAREQKTASA